MMEREAYELMHRQEASNWWFVGRRNVIAELISCRIKPAADTRILEAGCGTGGNLALLASFGNLSALEYDDDAREIARNRCDVDIAAGALPDDIRFDDASFDLIALLDVLEHLDQDTASLSALRAKLAPGGRIIITVPAAPWLWSDHDVMHHHKRRYTKKQLKALLSKVGFSNIDVGYFNCLLFPLAVVDRVLKNLKLRKHTGSDDVGPLMNRLFTSLFSLEARLLHKVVFPFGLSVYAIASHKP